MHGRGWRMDPRAVLLQSTPGPRADLHGAGHTFDGSQYYVYKNGQMRCGMVVFQFQLADVNEGDGGFCCIPGSHKANVPCPRDIWSGSGQDAVRPVPCKAGDLIIFKRGDTHGTLPGPPTTSGARSCTALRTSTSTFAGGYHETHFPEWVSELTEAHARVLSRPTSTTAR
jgi:ectoine hydroxylase-related dioxygenase (phytanoyl-CoA dioxygenase family)